MPRRIVGGISRTLAVISASLILIIMVAMVADVARRYLTGRSIPGVVEYTEVLMVGVIYLGLAYAQRKGDHIGVDIFTTRMPPRVSQIVQAIGLIIVSLALLWMAWETWQVAQRSMATGEYRFGLARVPIWPARLTIPLGITVLLCEIFFDVVDLLRGREVKTGKPSEMGTVADADTPIAGA
jgi:TRAP-type C4-dicarboxylate transport system permease small subunit